MRVWVTSFGPYSSLALFAVPLPLEELHQRTLRAGRAPSIQAIDKLLQSNNLLTTSLGRRLA
jgi:hypothetical protein